MINYSIKKITITEETAWLLIPELETCTIKQDEYKIDKKGVEVVIPSEDKRIDVVMKIQFHSEYHRVDGGVECINRSVTNDLKMFDHDMGDEIEFESPVDIEGEIRNFFYI